MNIQLPLFWEPRFWSANKSFGENPRRIEGDRGETIYVTPSEKAGLIPGGATFGGFWISEPHRIPPPDFATLFREIFRSYEHEWWSIKLPPGYFFPRIFASQSEALLELGGEITEETNSTIQIQGRTLEECFAEFGKDNRRKVIAFARRGGIVRRANSSELGLAYHLLASNRARRGVTLSLSEAKFIALLNALPEFYSCWVAIFEEQIVGAAYTVEISGNTTYVLYWGDSPLGREISVTASLAYEILATATKADKEFLDLGISSVGGVIDQGLLLFKQRLGADIYAQPRFLIRPKRR